MAKTKIKKIKKAKVKKYSAQRLAVILILMLVLEGVLLGGATPADWQQAVKVLDVSSAVSETAGGMQVAFQPMVDVIDDVEQFYIAAANQLAQILDLSDADFSQVAFIYHAVNDFYQQAATQMIAVLNVSSNPLWSGTVSGISIQK